MTIRAAVAAASLLAFAAVGAGASAQTYSRPTAAPRTTDAKALAAQAHEREIHERFNRGVAAEERADWSAAATEFRRVVALDPAEPRGSTARYDLALAEIHLGHDNAAAGLLDEALHRDPGFAAAAANLVALHLQRGNVAAARAAADRFIAVAPDSALARYDRGLAALRAGDLTTARADFRALIGKDATYAVAHYDLALVELRAGRDDAARAELEQALTLSPGYARARFALGTVLMRGGRRADARLAFDRCARDAADPALRALAIDLRDKL
ncbi:MAG: Flp pilus assembly protein TadD [Candidatus Eremiobacteraeota bacterium]|nr:Flp pilus assembly protein TadD [Candidatus Eremiobacteraeota bacterium]